MIGMIGIAAPYPSHDQVQQTSASKSYPEIQHRSSDHVSMVSHTATVPAVGVRAGSSGHFACSPCHGPSRSPMVIDDEQMLAVDDE